MVQTKLLQVPEFSKLPGTDAADVEENIVNWLNKGMTSQIEKFLRPDTSRPNGYRFVRSEDFKEVKTVEQVISKVPVKITYIRRVHTTDHLCPLYFRTRCIDIMVTIGNESFEFKSDNHLKLKIKALKK
jgi:hypothetical protein